MSDEKIRRTLTRLHEELENADDVEPALKSLLQEVDADIHKLLGTEAEPAEGFMDRVDELVAQFAASHPQAERFVRELVDSLGKLGI
jgi:predicted component of type VI protein secretion system